MSEMSTRTEPDAARQRGKVLAVVGAGHSKASGNGWGGFESSPERL